MMTDAQDAESARLNIRLTDMTLLALRLWNFSRQDLMRLADRDALANSTIRMAEDLLPTEETIR